MKRLLWILLVLALLGALAWWLHVRDTGSTLSEPLTDFAIADTAAVDRIFIAEPDGRAVDLRRNADGIWTVNGISEANQYQVRLLLKTFYRAEVRAPVPKSAEANVLRIMASQVKKVEIYQGGDQPQKVWYVGHSTKDHVGTYMVLEKPGTGRSNVPFVMGMSGFTGFLSSRFHADLDAWRSTVVFAYPSMDAIAEVRVDNTADPANSYILRTKPNSPWELLDGSGTEVPMDTARANSVLAQVRSMNFELVERTLSPAQCDSVRKSQPLYRLTVTDRAGSIRTVPIFRKAPYAGQRDMEGALLETDRDRLHAALDDTTLVVVQQLTFDRVLLPLSALRK
ncbi:MAG: hypothetical protein IPG10_08525 [Flavobacteriales bacterium]|nr:hypothetical protein [Flavobacteriales bacterium]MBK6752258.1 hypothetical protein [Flavobacteriales bacterium]MBK9537766.1 hypothetical protein [Flavobacteriales bacterium]